MLDHKRAPVSLWEWDSSRVRTGGTHILCIYMSYDYFHKLQCHLLSPLCLGFTSAIPVKEVLCDGQLTVALPKSCGDLGCCGEL